MVEGGEWWDGGNGGDMCRKTFDHRAGDPYNEYTYDDLDRLTAVGYHDLDTEAFNMDDLGNRTGNQTLPNDGPVETRTIRAREIKGQRKRL